MAVRSRAWRIAVAVMVGALVLPVASGGAAARAAWESLSDIAPKQRQVDERSPSSSSGIDAETLAQKHESMDGTTALVAWTASGRGGPNAPNPLDVARTRDVVVVQDALIRVIVESAGDPAQAVAAVRSVGGTVEAEYRDLVQALVAPVMLERLAADPAVAYVRQPAGRQQDAVTGEGVAASGAPFWQADSYTGQNVKVAVIDFGFTGYATRQAQGDLPASLTTQDFCGGQFNAAGGEHGTAVAEIVYEMAPSITLYLLCVDTEVNLGQAKDYAKTNGIQIIVMSASWFNTSRGDGTGSASSPNATVADARANGILWVNSAGNRAQQHHSATFSDTDGNQQHNYTAGDNGNTIFLSQGQSACVYLRWDNWPTTNQDLDLILAISATGVGVAQSATRQTGAQPPREGICYTNTTGTSQNFAIVVRKFSATINPFFELFITPGPNLEYQTPAGSVTEPASSPSAMAVAAICWQTDRREDYSSQGPTIDGRVKPDIAGQSVVSSASFGGFGSCPAGSNGTGGFNGTSAAAPHVAGAAALVKGANPSFTPAQLQAFLEGRAGDLGPGGKDNLFGSGKLLLGDSPLPPPNCSPRPSISVQASISGGRQNVSVSVTGTNNRLLSIGFSSGAAVPVNALLDLPDGRTGVTGTPTWTAGPGATQVTFYVRRQNPGAAVTVPFTVTDRCGAWRTFVGGGTGAPGF
jgi:subtilisin family serine protease